MKVETISHESGDQLPILLDRDGMPILTPNEFLISRRYLSPNTLARNARELLVFYLWLNKEGIFLKQKIMSERFFSEAEFKGGLIEFLRKEHSIKEKKVRKLAISPSTFNLCIFKKYTSLLEQLSCPVLRYELKYRDVLRKIRRSQFTEPVHDFIAIKRIMNRIPEVKTSDYMLINSKRLAIPPSA